MSYSGQMPVSVEGLNTRAKELHAKVKQFIEEFVAPIESEYFKHAKSANKWKVFQPVEELKVSFFYFIIFFFFFYFMGAQWHSGRVFDSRPRGWGFEPNQLHCVVVLKQDTFVLA